MDISALLRRGNKIPMEGVTEAKFKSETEGMNIQKLPHLGIYPINNHQIQALLWMPTSACWQEPDMAVSWKALPVPDKYRSGCSKTTIGWSTGSSMKELEKVPKELSVFAAPLGGTTLWTNQYLQSSLGLNHHSKETRGGTYGSSCKYSRG